MKLIVLVIAFFIMSVCGIEYDPDCIDELPANMSTKSLGKLELKLNLVPEKDNWTLSLNISSPGTPIAKIVLKSPPVELSIYCKDSQKESFLVHNINISKSLVITSNSAENLLTVMDNKYMCQVLKHLNYILISINKEETVNIKTTVCKSHNIQSEENSWSSSIIIILVLLAIFGVVIIAYVLFKCLSARSTQDHEQLCEWYTQHIGDDSSNQDSDDYEHPIELSSLSAIREAPEFQVTSSSLHHRPSILSQRHSSRPTSTFELHELQISPCSLHGNLSIPAESHFSRPKSAFELHELQITPRSLHNRLSIPAPTHFSRPNSALEHHILKVTPRSLHGIPAERHPSRPTTAFELNELQISPRSLHDMFIIPSETQSRSGASTRRSSPIYDNFSELSNRSPSITGSRNHPRRSSSPIYDNFKTEKSIDEFHNMPKAQLGFSPGKLQVSNGTNNEERSIALVQRSKSQVMVDDEDTYLELIRDSPTL